MSFQVLLYLRMGSVVFGVDIGNASIPAAVVVLIMPILAFGVIGIRSASFTMVFRRGDPISFLVGIVSTPVGGVFYRFAVLPAWLQPLYYRLSLIYSLSAMRQAILQGDSLSALAPEIGMLGMFAAFLVPLGLVAFQFAIRRAEIEGILTRY